jgi:AcrR family transcriptional regulator
VPFDITLIVRLLDSVIGMSLAAQLTDPELMAPGRRRFSARQEQVLQAVERIFLREGVGGIRMGDLATEVGCSRSTLYEIAPSKDDLLLLVIDRLMRRLSVRGADAIATADTNVDRMAAMLASGALDFADPQPSARPHAVRPLGRRLPRRP